MCDLTGQVAVITGAGGGIGRASALAFARAGAAVLLIDRDSVVVNRVAEEVDASGADVMAVQLDITDRSRVLSTIGDALGRWDRVNVLHNNAGAFRDDGPFEELDVDAWNLVQRVNVLGTAYMCGAVLPRMVESRRGAIVNTSSAHARLGDSSWVGYQVSKAGVEALTRSIATRYARWGIRCNALAPGLIETPGAITRLPPALTEAIRAQNLVGRLGRPEEVADVAVFLASEGASFITGQILHVDGGLSMHMPLAARAQGGTEEKGHGSE